MFRNIYCLLTMFFLVGNAYGQEPVVSQPVTAVPVALPGAYLNTFSNYVRTWDPAMRTADVSTIVSDNRSVMDVQQKTEYVDGLGRPLQMVRKRMSTAGNDVVAAVVYDVYGRQIYKYLPYVQYTDNINDGNFKTSPFTAQQAYYQNTTLNPGVAGETIYYNEVEYEASPLNRVVKTYAVGNAWGRKGGNRPVTTQYQVNTNADSVRIWRVASGLPVSAATYSAGQLFKNIVTDEMGNQLVDYSDNTGRLVLKKNQLANTPGTAHSGWLCTYYIYDDLGNLRFVMPPKAVQAIASNWSVSSVMEALCFAYTYDGRNRMIIKKVPGAGEVHMVYDRRDRLVFIQDAMQRSRTEWLAYFYDNQDRQMMTAVYRSGSSRDALQQSMNNGAASGIVSYDFPANADLFVNNYGGESVFTATSSITFTENFDSGEGGAFETLLSPDGSSGNTTLIISNPLPGISSADLTPLTYTYYDNYNYAGKLGYESADLGKTQAGSNLHAENQASPPGTTTEGLVTGYKVRVLGTDQWLTTSSYYDDKGRSVQVVSENNVGGRDVLTNLFDFKSKLLSSYLYHRNPRSNVTSQVRVLTNLTYDAAGRVIGVSKQVNDEAAQLIVENIYDETGQLKTKRLGVTGGTTQLDNLSYTYNIRGWIRGINNDYVNTANSTVNWFGQEISYDRGFTNTQFNGNIAGVTWKSGGDGISRAYGYNYDKSNRLTYANFNQQNSGNAAWTKDQVDFTVSNLQYDLNGNITSMTQRGMIGATPDDIDRLTYTYQLNSNKLAKVDDPQNTTEAKLGDFLNGTNTGDDYSYDSNGNTTADANKGISSITYNYLNLPSVITIDGRGSISYQYDAKGNKLKKTVVDNATSKTAITDYVSGFVYVQDSLQYMGHEEGRIRPAYALGQPVSYLYEYFEKDYLDNVRVVLGTETSANVYTATMETAAAEKETVLFSNVENTRTALPVGYPVDATTSPNAFVARLNKNAYKIGPSLVLRVMAGDTISIGTKAFYKTVGNNKQDATSQEMVRAVINAFSGAVLNNGTHGAERANYLLVNNFTPADYAALQSSNQSSSISDRPRAYLNYALFDDKFNMVSGNSGVIQLQGRPDEIQNLCVDKAVMKKSGFLYVYTSNESTEDVYFDNLVVVHNIGPLLEESHYYPFGLTMARISSKALKGMQYPENKKKFSSMELDNELDLNWYQFKYRSMDPQIGRFMQIDPLSVKYTGHSTYAYAENKVTIGVDQEGLELAPKNSVWFKSEANDSYVYGTNMRVTKEEVFVVDGKVPSVFKDASGNVLFSAMSVGLTPGGKVNLSNGHTVIPSHRLPPNPSWPWSPGDPDATESTAGGAMGTDLEANKAYSGKAGAAMGAHMEIHNWLELRTNKQIWDAYTELNINIKNYDRAAAAVRGSAISAKMKADLTNFINDGTLPPLDIVNLRSSVQKGLNVMKAGIEIMQRNNISVSQNTLATFKLYQAVLDFLRASKTFNNPYMN